MKKIENLQIYESALIIVDMVNGFVTEGILHDKKIGRIIPRQLELINENKQRGGLTIFIKDTHDKGATEFRRFQNTEHCVRGTTEQELVKELKPYEEWPDTISIKKNSTSFMESPDFRELVAQMKNLNQIDIAGCCTDICIVNGAIALSNYFDQRNIPIKIQVQEDAIATFDEENRQDYVKAAKLLMQQQGIQLMKKGGK